MCYVDVCELKMDFMIEEKNKFSVKQKICSFKKIIMRKSRAKTKINLAVKN